MTYVVVYGCGEAIIVEATTAEEAMVNDDLGCPPSRVVPLAEVRLKGGTWEKNGVLRCEVEL